LEIGVAIYRLLENQAFEPEQIELLAKAYEDALHLLNIAKRDDPLTWSIAKTIISEAKRGECDPERLCQAAVTEHTASAPANLQTAGVGNTGEQKPGPTVLIVEDDEAFAYATSRYLQSLGYTTVVANGSLAAFRELDRQQVDVVITDMRLHKGEPHGASLGRMIRNRDPAMPVFLVTAIPSLLNWKNRYLARYSQSLSSYACLRRRCKPHSPVELGPVFKSVKLFAVSVKNASGFGASLFPGLEQVCCPIARPFGVHLVDVDAMQNVRPRAIVGP
jgi:CheY-like chemotaxis protein